MAETAQLSAKPRNELGSRANKRLRDSGFIPGVIYGHKEAVVPVTLPKKDVVTYLDRGTFLFDLAVLLGQELGRHIVPEFVTEDAIHRPRLDSREIFDVPADGLDPFPMAGQIRMRQCPLQGLRPLVHQDVPDARIDRARPVQRLHVRQEAGGEVAVTGAPFMHHQRRRSPLVRPCSIARPDPFGLGLDVTPQSAVINRWGVASRRLYALGPVTRGTFWEITSVPDIRRQCWDLAGALAAEAGTRGLVRTPQREPRGRDIRARLTLISGRS